ncbi:MAG: hypothetical protein RL368_984 [Pseudomonadota bacterium]|jgi:ferrous iron transport protein A
MSSTSLAQLKPGQIGIVTNLDIEEGLYRRLLATGVRIGKPIEMLRSIFSHGPLHVRIGMTEIMLRRTEAQNIKVTITS